jgi:predicted Fe-Mo cluster-binding NifX family protein
MRVALTVWNGRVSPVFDVCTEALILDIDNGRVTASFRLALSNEEPAGRTHQLADSAVGTLICGAISNEARQQLESRGIHVIAFVAGDAEPVIAAFTAGQLPDDRFSMPGCRRRHRARGAGQGGGCRHGAGREHK